MTTLIIHGTMTVASAVTVNWWWNSWQAGGFLHAVAGAMENAQGSHDVWRINNRAVSGYRELRAPGFLKSLLRGSRGQIATHQGHFLWSGGDSYIEREAGAENLVRYLNRIHSLSDEPIRIIAHSHGANLVKMASASAQLGNSVFIEKAAFLGVPHFVIRLPDESYYPYQLNPARFGRIVNLYSERDSVQVDLSGAIPSTLVSPNWRHFTPPEVFQYDSDPAAHALYDSFVIATEDDGVAAHTALHGAHIGQLCGQWLAGGHSFADILGQNAHLLPVPAGDHG